MTKKGHSCVFVGGVEDIELCSRLAHNSKAISLAGETSLLQTIALLRLCSALITNDSAPTHLAWIAGCRTITIYGPTSPIFGFAPRGETDIILENTFLKCRPCAIHGGNVCPIGTHECMKSITPLMATRTISAIG
ncbi:MAG: glycosyltransferase family 9 protein [Ignavibacteria bacterium]|nr:glycosyltransferase family 9 protein [Ignavibacteria bacterium]